MMEMIKIHGMILQFVGELLTNSLFEGYTMCVCVCVLENVMYSEQFFFYLNVVSSFKTTVRQANGLENNSQMQIELKMQHLE